MNSPSKFRIVLIEHEMLLRSVLARMILLSDRFSLLADYPDAEAAKENCFQLDPEIIVVDVDFSPEESIEFIEIARKELPQAGVIALSATNDPAIVHELSRVEVQGFIQRSEPLEVLEEAMIEVAQHKRYLPAAFFRQEREFAQHAHENHALTTRERLLLRKVAAGLTSRSIAAEMKLSPRSVETYRSRLMRKLRVRNTAGLVDYAFRHRVILQTIPLESHLLEEPIIPRGVDAKS